MSQVHDSTNVSASHFSSTTNVCSSPQLALAMLEMQLATANKEQAMQGIDSIKSEQAKKKEMADMLNKARDAQAGEHYLNNWGDEDGIDSNLKKWASQNGISLPDQDSVGRPKKSGSADKDKIKAGWDKVIAQIQTKMDTVGADIQTSMVQLQDMMGQYNSYMQGANSAIAQANQVLSSLAKGQ